MKRCIYISSTLILLATIVAFGGLRIYLTSNPFVEAISMSKDHIDQLNQCQKIADCVSGSIITYKAAADLVKSECSISYKTGGKEAELQLRSSHDFTIANNLCSLLYKSKRSK